MSKKFRAWDKKTNKMYPVETLAWDLSGNLEEIWLAGVELTDDDEESYTNLRTPDEVILEQFTGLLDRNGKEIYEGDIIDYNSDGQAIGYVKYNAPHYELIDKEGYTMFLKGSPHQTIIGNIHENPELLTQRKVTNEN